MTAKWSLGKTPGIWLTIALAAALGQSSLAQNAGSAPSSGTASPTVDHYSPADLQEIEKKLEQNAGASGLATQILKKYSSDFTELGFRNQDGKAELHQKFGDFYLVLEGNATLVTGGHIVNPATTGPGEVRGDSVQDGTAIKLKQGDIVHISPNIPHQLLVAKGTKFKYFIIKVPESD